jgi:uncharacterized protein (TIGR01732 family)
MTIYLMRGSVHMYRNENNPQVMGANMPPVMGANMPPVMGANMPPVMGENVPPPQAVMGASMAPQPYCYPAYAYCAPVNRCDDFVLIVILFILLIIIGGYYCFS